MTTNKNIADIFNNIGSMLEIIGDNPFKIRAYKKASATIKALDQDLNDISDNSQLTDIKGIGKDLAKKINEFITTGRIKYYEELKSTVPEELLKIKNIQGIGPKMLQTLFNDFGVKKISDLENVLGNEEFINKKGVGTKKINELKVGIKLFKSHLNKINLGIALPAAEALCSEILKIKGTDKAEITGDLKRGKETVELIEIIVSTSDLNKIERDIKNLTLVNNESFIKKDDSIEFTLGSGIPAVIYFTDEKNYYKDRFLTTGSVEHVKKIRDLYKQTATEFTPELFTDQEKIYSGINLKFIPNELREGKDEFELAKSGLPDLVRLEDIKGDLHTHSTWSDGKSTIEEMAHAANKLGYEYIAITDHSVSSRIANGLDIERLREKKRELLEKDKSTKIIKIIYGSEVDIKPDGTLDYPDEILKDLDMVVASVHSSFKMNEEDMTRRITRALSNPYVCALGHPTGRLIGERNPYELDISEVIKTAKKYDKALEVNASYMRLDLKDEHIRMALESGVKLIISTDAHHTDQLNQMRYGISTARRGGASKASIINTLPLSKLTEWLNEFK